MDVDIYERVNTLLLGALDLPAEERTRYLDENCNSREIRREVESLLESDSEPEVLSQPIVDWLAVDLESGTRLGPYTIERELGRGGMGVVYLARRADGEFDRQVAIKVLKRGMDTEAVVRRFLRERQILARLQHPHIAALLDGGTTPDHRPYLVMEFVKGEPIDRFCSQHQLDIGAKIGLVLTVCRALEFAHQNLVVHRDIKPSNILVDEQGRPKLLDFGIAKLLGAEDSSTSTATAEGHRPMTLGYASPEQIEHRAVGTATDVYGLAVVFFEILVGERPFQRDSQSPEDLRRAILEDEPEKPSVVAARRPDRAKDLSQLRGDLDHIVLKALAKKPSDRYASFEPFVRDLKAFQQGRPVSARPNTSFYLGLRFVRRHWRGLAVSMALLLTLAGFMVDRTLQHRETVRHKERAERVLGVVLGLFEAPGELTAENRQGVKQLLDKGRAEVEVEFSNLPRVKAELLTTLGKSYLELELAEPAEESFLAALENLRSVGAGLEIEAGQLLYALSYTAQDLGRFEVAQQRVRAALQVFRRELGEEHQTTLDARELLGFLEMRLGRYEAAETQLRRALEDKRRILGNEHQNTLNGMAHLGLLLNRRGRHAEAEALLREAYERTKKRYGDSDITSSMMNNLIAVLIAQGKYREAAPLGEKLVRHRRQAGAPRELPIAVNTLAVLQMTLGEIERSAELSREAVALSVATHGPEHVTQIALRANLAKVEHRLGNLDEAEAQARRALELAGELLEPGHARTAYARVVLASILNDRSKADEAAMLARSSLETKRQQLQPGSWKIWRAEAILGRSLLAIGDSEEGERLLESGFRGLASTLRSDGFRLRRAAAALSDHYENTGRPDRAREIREELAALMPDSASP